MKERIIVNLSKDDIDFSLPPKERRNQCNEDFDSMIIQIQELLDSHNQQYKIVKKLYNIYSVIIQCDSSSINIIKSFEKCVGCTKSVKRNKTPNNFSLKMKGKK